MVLKPLAALLMVGTISGILLAMLMNNGGGAWDNAKKFIETGAYGGKRVRSPQGRAVVGDTVGDPFKDTAGPSLHVLIKLLATVTLVLAPALRLSRSTESGGRQSGGLLHLRHYFVAFSAIVPAKWSSSFRKFLNDKPKRFQYYKFVPFRRLWPLYAAIFGLFAITGFFGDMLNLGSIPYVIVILNAVCSGFTAVMYAHVAMRLTRRYFIVATLLQFPSGLDSA